MKKVLSIISLVSALFILTSCGDSLKTISPEGDYFTIEVDSNYQNVMMMKDFIIAERLPGTDPDNYILLQARKGNIADDLLYSMRSQLPDEASITKEIYENVLNEQIKNVPEVIDFQTLSVTDEENEIAYVIETTTADHRPYYEYCIISLKSGIITVCIGTSRDPKAAEKAISSVEFHLQ